MSSRTERIGKAVTLLARAFRTEADELLLEAYLLGLEGVPIEKIEDAARRALSSCRFMPTPAEIRELTGDATPKDRAQLAWEIVRRHIGRLGGYVSPDFEDRAINAAIRGLGGWVQLTAKPTEELDSFTRHAFIQAYPAWVSRTDGEPGDAIPGIMQQQEGGRYEVVAVPCDYLPRSERRRIESGTRAAIAGPAEETR